MIDVTISRREGDLYVSVGPVGDWFPNDYQLEKIRKKLTHLIEGMLKGQGEEPVLRVTSPPGAHIEVRSGKIPEHIQKKIEKALEGE